MSSQSVAPSLGEHLQAVTEALAAARTQQDVFGVVLTPALQALDAVAGAVLLVDETGTRLELSATQGYEEGAQTLWQDGLLSRNVPAGDALEQHKALFFEKEGELVRAYPELEARTGGVAAVATAVLPMFLDDSPLGVIILDFEEPHEFTPEEERFLRTLAAQCAIALGRARLTTDLQRQVQERTQRIEADARAQQAFVAFTEAVGTETDVLALARQAIAVLGARFPDGSFSYLEHEPRSERWQARAWSDNHSAPQVTMITAGFPQGTPLFADALRTRGPVFRDGWDAEQEQIEHTEDFGSGATYPLVVDGEVCGILGMAVRNQPRWEERDRVLVRAVGRSLNLALERAEQARQLRARGDELEARTLALERFAELTRSQELDAATLIRRAQQAVAALIGEGFAVYYELDGATWRLKSQVGSPDDETIQASLESALPYDLVLNFRIPWESGTPFYQDAYDPVLDQGVPGTEALASTAALPLFVGTRRQGMFGYGLKVSRSWTRADWATLETAVTSLGLSLERAEQARVREEERAALDAFVRFTEASTQLTDVVVLAEQAKDVLRATLGEYSVAYYELEGGRWKARVLSDDIPELTARTARQGFPADVLSFARPFQECGVVFTEGWDAEREGAEHTEMYGAGAFYPYFKGGEPHSLFNMATTRARTWTERERSVFQAVARSLQVAFERAEGARQLQVQNAELDARTRALEGFAALTQDLTVQGDPHLFVRRAQEVVMTLLPPGYALYYEREGEHWCNRVQVGDVGNADLQAFIDAGPLVGLTPSVDVPWTTGEPLYQDEYAQGSDTPAEMVQHVSTVASLPVLRHGEVVGVFIAVLFGVRAWTPIDRVVLETVVASLGLALKRAEQAQALQQRTAELEHSNTELARSNAELEQFAYIASHDLQAPIRAVTSFAGIIDKRYGGQLDERGRLYLRQIMESGEHMKRLVDDLLAFSRVHTERRAPLPVDSKTVFDGVHRRLHGEIEAGGARVTRGELPVVLADAQQLDQLLQNLISNGLKYHREGVLPQVHVSAERDGEMWRFAISDNGLGIESQYFERIFVIFQRLHGREAYEGTGIGLAVCKKIVERHGGRLWLQSTPGEGSTFFFTLPAG